MARAGGSGSGPQRREFLKRGVASAAALLASPRLVGPAAAAAPPAPPPALSTKSPPNFELGDATIAELRAGMTSGRHTAASLARIYCARMDGVDRGGPSLNAVIERNPDALAIAESLDRERKARGPRGPLHGIPILIKDNIDTHDRMTTTAGSLALEGSIPARDAFLVERLRAAGAVILGKTNLSEWANIRSSYSSSGWSGRGGQTRNPHVLDRSPCGSSSGSAAAVAASLCAVAVGTETDGSIVAPSSACGIVGIKPTVGLVSRSGIIPISPSQDSAGAMARTVTDAAILLGALAGADPRDPITVQGAHHAEIDYTRHLDKNGLKGARIGVVRKLFNAGDLANALVEVALLDLRKGGAILVDPVELDAAALGEPELEVLLFELKDSLNRYLAGLGKNARVKSLKDVIDFNQHNAPRELPYFAQDLFEKAEAKGPLTSPEYLKARASCLRIAREGGIDAVMAKHQLDALVAPTMGPSGPIDLVIGDHFLGGASSPAAVAGYPHVTVPAGTVFGLPVGLSLFGRAWSEPTLLKLAYAYEQATHHRRPPRFLPTAATS